MTLTAITKNDVSQSAYKISVSGVIRYRAQTMSHYGRGKLLTRSADEICREQKYRRRPLRDQNVVRH
jgi:hypothetical protein